MVLESYVLSPMWIWSALALLPLIILYFLRPRPQTQTIPSLMFLLRDKKKKRLRGFLQKFIPSLLFLLQLLILVALVGALLQPYVNVPLIQSAENTIIVLDDSASMHVRDSDGVRYEKAVDEINGLLGERNTLILAGATAQVVLEEASASETRQYLRSWEPAEQPTHLRIALQETLNRVDAQTAVIVASDFIDTEPEASPNEALSALQARSGELRRINVGTQNTDNIGIIDVEASDLTTTITIKNFDTQPRSTTACIAGVCKDFSLTEQETQQWTFSTPAGVSEVLLDTNDAFAIDDKAYISSEEQTTVDVLVVTNGQWSEHPLAQLLEALDETTPLSITTTINEPPQLADVDHDLIIFSEIDAQSVVERTIRDAEEHVRNGGAASIIVHQQGLFALPYKELLPVSFIEEAAATSVLNTNTQQSLVGIEYGSTPTHFAVKQTRESIVLATDEQERPVITLAPTGRGRVLYYGLPERASFSASPDYPLFWKNTLDALLGRLSASQRTRTTGDVLTVTGSVTLPDGQRSTGRIEMTQIGTYTTSRGVLVANLNNAAESSISARTQQTQPTTIDVGAENTQPQPYTQHLLILAAILAVLEILYLKYRGDL